MLRLLLIGTGAWLTIGLMAIGSPSVPDDARRSLTLREADMLAVDISKSLQLIGFQPRYLGALGQPDIRGASRSLFPVRPMGSKRSRWTVGPSRAFAGCPVHQTERRAVLRAGA